MGLWCKDLPVVRVERSSVPKPVTLVMAYYEHPRFVRQHLAQWASYPAHLFEQLAFVLVDDGSPVSPLADVLRDQAVPASLRVFRIEQDRPWNWLAARNIGAHEADAGWLLLTDFDHLVPVETLESLIYGVRRTDTIYGFSRAEHTGAEIPPHQNSFLLTRDLFWKWGGYDETLAGHYGSNGDAVRRMAAAAKMAILADRLVRHEFVGDSSTTRYARKQPADAAAVKRIVSSRGKGWRAKTLSFAYHEVTMGLAVHA